MIDVDLEQLHKDRDEEAAMLRARREARYGPSLTREEIKAAYAELDAIYFPSATPCPRCPGPCWLHQRNQGAQGD